VIATTPASMSPLAMAVDGTRRLLRRPRPPSQGPLEQFVNTLLFVAHTQNVPSLRALHSLFGARLRVFGGETFGGFSELRELIAREPEKIDWFSGPIDDRADYLTKGYVPFLLAGPNHTLRRKRIAERIAKAHLALDDLETLLATDSDNDRVLARFLFRHLVKVELDDTEVDWFLDFRRRAQPMVLLPKALRTTLLKPVHDLLLERRLYFLARIEDAGERMADSWFDALWFNAGTVGFYPKKAIELLQKQPELQAPIRDEVALPPGKRPLTRALIHETLRIFGRIASTNHVEQGRVRIALLATAVVDPARYHNPLEVDLNRDHGDTLIFAGAAPTRKCPAELFAPDVMATIVAQRVRSGALDQIERQN
jgi:hypothetical protein